MSETVVARWFDKMRDEIERFEKVTKTGGFLEKQIEKIGGDPSGLKNIWEILDELHRAVDEADYHARAHLGENEELDKPKYESNSIDKTTEIANIMRLAGISDKE